MKSVSGVGVRELADAQLRQIAEYAGRRYLEVERGLRGKQCLQRFRQTRPTTSSPTRRRSPPAGPGVLTPRAAEVRQGAGFQ